MEFRFLTDPAVQVTATTRQLLSILTAIAWRYARKGLTSDLRRSAHAVIKVPIALMQLAFEF